MTLEAIQSIRNSASALCYPTFARWLYLNQLSLLHTRVRYHEGVDRQPIVDRQLTSAHRRNRTQNTIDKHPSFLVSFVSRSLLSSNILHGHCIIRFVVSPLVQHSSRSLCHSLRGISSRPSPITKSRPVNITDTGMPR